MILFREVETHDANFIHSLMSAIAYKDIFYEKDTSVSEWKSRIESLKKDRGTDNYLIYEPKKNTKLGWIMYELENQVCFLHLIAINYEEIGKKYGYNSLEKLIRELENRPIKRILLDVQENNFRAVNFYKNFGFVIIGSEKQVVENNKTQEYLKMEYIL